MQARAALRYKVGLAYHGNAAETGEYLNLYDPSYAPTLDIGQVVHVRLYILFLSHPVSFPFLFSLQHPLFSSLFSRGNHQIFRALSRV